MENPSEYKRGSREAEKRKQKAQPGKGWERRRWVMQSGQARVLDRRPGSLVRRGRQQSPKTWLPGLVTGSSGRLGAGAGFFGETGLRGRGRGTL